MKPMEYLKPRGCKTQEIEILRSQKSATNITKQIIFGKWGNAKKHASGHMPKYLTKPMEYFKSRGCQNIKICQNSASHVPKL